MKEIKKPFQKGESPHKRATRQAMRLHVSSFFYSILQKLKKKTNKKGNKFKMKGKKGGIKLTVMGIHTPSIVYSSIAEYKTVNW